MNMPTNKQLAPPHRNLRAAILVHVQNNLFSHQTDLKKLAISASGPASLYVGNF